ncbi:hypothetical protein KUTeg_006933 [Tegillarca granosa]|uniref:Uncharacterized protein n=1 Tax=Tegillarca granosa TaxID=220873 RepID=A0ABQ9FBR9_TEGGR|nr:hypothetical protein KUTeg_006933 [Tegillarca granosa]
MTTLLEELDAISFKQKFVDKMIMSDKDFECQFRTQELGRRARTTLLLEYVLTKNANVMNVFFEVIGMTYNFLTDTLLKRNFIDRDETEEKQRLFTKTAVQHNEIEDNITANSELNIDSVLSPVCSLGIGDITVQHTNNVNTPEQIVPPVCSGHEFLKPKDVTIHFVDGLLNKDRNNGMQTTVPCQNLNRAPLSRPVENFDDNLHCRGSNNKTDQTSETSSYLSSSGPRAMLLGGTNSMNNNTQTQPLIYSNGLKDLLLKQSSESKFDSGSVELPLPSDSVANQSPKIPSDLNLNGSNITSSEQIGNLSAINSMTEQSSQNTHDLSISEEERLLRSNNATGKSSTSYPFSDTTSQSFHFSSDLTSSGSREMNLAHKTQNPKLHQSLEFRFKETRN